MEVGIMITNGNNVHPADYHAEVTAGKIVVIASEATPDKQSAGRELRKKVEAILIAHHEGVHAHEQSKLAEEGLDRCKGVVALRDEMHAAAVEEREPVVTADMNIDASEHINDEIIAEIAAAAKGSVLEDHFARKDVQDVIRDILHHETRSQMNVHRLVRVEADRLAKAARK